MVSPSCPEHDSDNRRDGERDEEKDEVYKDTVRLRIKGYTDSDSCKSEGYQSNTNQI